MKKEDFIKLFSDDPNSDDVMTEINRLYDEEARLTADFNAADAEFLILLHLSVFWSRW